VSKILSMWTVYDHPSDYPDKYVARCFSGEQPTSSIIIAENLEVIRYILCLEMGLTRQRSPEDDPKIVEVWL
jgi:hypothetical protein